MISAGQRLSQRGIVAAEGGETTPTEIGIEGGLSLKRAAPFILRRLLAGQVGGLGALENLVNVGGGLLKPFDSIGPIRHQESGFHLLHPVGYRRR